MQNARLVSACSWVLLTAPVALAAEPEVAPTPITSGSATSPTVSEVQKDITLLRPASVQDGAIVVVEAVVPEGCDKPKLGWLGTSYPMVKRADRYQALLPVPLGRVSAGEELTVKCKQTAHFKIPVVEGTYPESQLTVDPKFSAPAPARAAEEQKVITASFKHSLAERLWTDTFFRPALGVETSPFGVRRTFNGKIDSRHRGLDLDGKIGDPIFAANDGVVVLASNDFYFIGSAVFIDHGNELFTMYFHMSQVDVKVGDRVKRGQQLGLVGKSGRVTGPHLHFAVKIGNTYVNPADLLHLTPGAPLVASTPVSAEAPAATGR